MSALQQQLQALATPQTNVYKQLGAKPSFLFHQKDAATLSRDGIFEKGSESFKSLCSFDPRFESYGELFDENTKGVQRFVADVDTNKQLDEKIEGFLILLSPHFLVRSDVNGAMEWLIQRYSVNEMNVDAVMMCILPFYDCSKFSLLLKILDITRVGSSGERNKWNWLSNAKKSGMPPSKDTVSDQWKTSAVFRLFCSTFLKKMIKVHKDHPYAINFYVTTVIGGLADVATRDRKSHSVNVGDHLNSVIRDLHLWLKAPSNHLVSGVYLIVMQLALSFNLKEQLWHEIIARLLKFKRKELLPKLTQCLVTVCHLQHLSSLEVRHLHPLREEHSVLSHLSDINSSKVASFLVPYAATHFMYAASEYTGDVSLFEKEMLSLVVTVSSHKLEPLESYAVIRNLLESIHKYSGSLPQKELWLPSVLEKLENSFPEGYDKASQYFSSMSDSLSELPYKEMATMMQQTNSRFLATSISQDIEMRAVADERKSGVVAAVDSIVTALQTVQTATADEKVVAAHHLMDVCIEATKNYTISKSGNNKNLEEEVMRVAREDSKIALKLMIKVAEDCFDVIRSTEKKDWRLHEGDENGMVLLAVKLLRVMTIKPGKFKEIIQSLLLHLAPQDISLLMSIWSWQSYLPFADVVDSKLQLWSLKKARDMMKEKTRLNSPDELVASLLSPLTMVVEDKSIQQEFRSTTIDIINIMSCKCDGEKVGSIPLLKILVKNKARLAADSQCDNIALIFKESLSKDNSLLLRLLKDLTNSKHPEHVTALALFCLSQMKNKTILKEFIPTIQKIMNKSSNGLSASESNLLYWCLTQFNDESILLLSEDNYWQVFVQAMKCVDKTICMEGEMLSPQTVLLQQIISFKILQSLGSDPLCGLIWSEIASISANIDVPKNQLARLHKALRGVHLQASFVLKEIRKLGIAIKATNIKATQAAHVKRENARRSLSNEAGELIPLSSNWRHFYLLVELLSEVQDIEQPWLLVEPLSDALGEAFDLGLYTTERLIQQVFSVLHHLITLTIGTPNQTVKSLCNLSVDRIVKIMRESTEPSTHRRALLLLSLVASYQPDAVLINTMEIFTFMGQGMQKARDDEFSYEVITSTISTLIPILVAKNKNDDRIVSVSEVFIDALPGIPIHRRLAIFKVLAEALTPQKLWLLIMLIVKSYVINGRSRIADDCSESKKLMPKELNFTLLLSSEFGAQLQVETAHIILEVLSSVPITVGNDYKKNWSTHNEFTRTLALSQFPSKQIRHFLYTGAGLLAQLFISENFTANVHSVAEDRNDTAYEDLQNNFKNFLTLLSAFISRVNGCVARTRGKDELAYKFWINMQKKLLEVFEGACSMLLPNLLIDVVTGLFDSPIVAVRLKAMEILRSRLLPSADFFDKSMHSKSLLPFVEKLSVIGNSANSVELRQVSLSSLQMLLRFLDNIENDLLKLVMNNAKPIYVELSSSSSSILIIQALLVTAECVTALQIESIFILPSLMPSLLKYLVITDVNDDLLLPLAASTVLCKLVENVPDFLSKKNVADVTELLCQCTWTVSNSSVKESRIASKLALLGTLMQTKVKPENLLPALCGTYESLASNGKNLKSLSLIINLLSGVIYQTDSSEMVKNLSHFIKLFITIMATRQNHCNKTNRRTVDDLEEESLRALTQLMFSLNQEANMTVFRQLNAWVDESDTVHARITFYKLVSNLASTFKVLFIKSGLADHVFSHWLKTLPLTTSKENKKDDDCLLLEHLLTSMYTVFNNDSVSFVSEAKFELLLDPLMAQINNRVGGTVLYQKRIEEQLKPVFVSLCAACRNDSLWAELNKKLILLVSEDVKPEVQAAVLSINHGIVETLKDDWLQPLLSDTLRHVTDALESPHPVVKDGAKTLLALLEEISPDAVQEQLQV